MTHRHDVDELRAQAPAAAAALDRLHAGTAALVDEAQAATGRRVTLQPPANVDPDEVAAAFTDAARSLGAALEQWRPLFVQALEQARARVAEAFATLEAAAHTRQVSKSGPPVRHAGASLAGAYVDEHQAVAQARALELVHERNTGPAVRRRAPRNLRPAPSHGRRW